MQKPNNGKQSKRSDCCGKSQKHSGGGKSQKHSGGGKVQRHSDSEKAQKRSDCCENSPCAVDALCGGCSNISIPYNKQCADKNAAMQKLFAGVKGNFELLPIIGMKDPFHYRNKIVSPFAPGKKKKASPSQGKRHTLDREVLTGMYAQGSHKLVPSNDCLIENEIGKRIVAAIVKIMSKYAIPPYNEDTGSGFLRHVVVRVGHASEEVLVTLVTNQDEFPHSKSFCKELIKAVPQITTVVQNVNTRQTNVILGEKEHTLYGPGFILDTLCGLSFRISSQSFYQVNVTQTEVLYNTAIALAGLSGTQTVIDAYCGTGTIGLVAASRGAARVIGVESNQRAVQDARENARHNGIKNATFVAADATQFMRDSAREGAGNFGNLLGEGEGAGAASAADPAASAAASATAHTPNSQELVLLMDPPRAGSTPEFLQAAAQLAPARIVYVSCNPETQVRDILLLQKYGYELQKVQPVDMFPHTAHVETVCLLVRRNSLHIDIDVDVEEMLQEKRGQATYAQIKDYVLEQNGLKVSSLYISQVKRKCGLDIGENYNKPKSEDSKQPQCPSEKEEVIMNALRHFGVI